VVGNSSVRRGIRAGNLHKEGASIEMTQKNRANHDAAVFRKLDWTTQAVGQQHTSPLRKPTGLDYLRGGLLRH